MRKLLYNALVGTTSIADLVPAERWIARSALTERPQTPFVVYAFGETTLALSAATARFQTFELWVHDEAGDYTVIDSILDEIEDVVSGWEQLEGYGYRALRVEWNGRSGDLADDDLRTAVRTGSFRAVGRRL
jgi:hypothetical protein